ncbi:acyltransferase [Hymenobacter sp. UV11]|uniref:acyltransferase family protein n=1 Tax=Hymenobacter sp. UV11 TaxID=1849735 RepID=UPI00105DC4E2|nr:acyltransferase [Hymenobacter sp. UV11]TFZ63338.1 acyltransferase [Hymenobacter sp. UV11]
MREHKANLDLLRATAITVVFIYHISQYVTKVPESLHKVFALGSYGVDLFFVLSGWLIGGIFFREYTMAGHVKLGNFWARRWLRTMPPYYAALLMSWLAVYYSRHQSFDPRYIFFLQNYSKSVPFFKISWSLCIEEHFYIVLPLLLYLSLKFKQVVPVCIALIVFSICMRWQYAGSEYPAFGYQLTATHLRLDGLLLGVLCAYMYNVEPLSWKRFSLWLFRLGLVGGIISIVLYFLDSRFMYSIGILSLSVFFAGVLCKSVNEADWSVSRSSIVSKIALSSYSIYLVHALAINLSDHFMPGGQIKFIGVALLSTGGMSFIFHFCIEEVSKRIRNNLFPNRVAVTLANQIPINK